MTNDLHGREDFRMEDFNLIYRICMEERDTKRITFIHTQETPKLGWFLLHEEIFLIG